MRGRSLDRRKIYETEISGSFWKSLSTHTSRRKTIGEKQGLYGLSLGHRCPPSSGLRVAEVAQRRQTIELYFSVQGFSVSHEPHGHQRRRGHCLCWLFPTPSPKSKGLDSSVGGSVTEPEQKRKETTWVIAQE
ncbi:hypothetical protein MRB53_034655 [Persea americana]|uniref:Uncharacterized protein n=1 Tax=Persea americana TaxID=3435 RepID=A0ACC2K2X6_PERAE|nr:hypothetical protein MRB53_034655 [Persea americana]